MRRSLEIIVEVVNPKSEEVWLHAINYESEISLYPFFYESSWLETGGQIQESTQRYCWSLPSQKVFEINLLKERLNILCPKHYRRIEREMEDTLWNEVWIENFNYLETQYFRIQELATGSTPTSFTIPPSDKEFLIQLVPSKSFGKGDHASTEAILKLIESNRAELSNCHVGLDIGSGNGILSIACVNLGVNKMYATEMEDEAFKALLKNIKLNAKEEDIFAFHTEQVNVISKIDVLLINVLSGAILPLLDQALSLRDLGKKCFIFLAGFNEHEASAIKDFMQQRNAQFKSSHTIRGWVALQFLM